MSEASNENVEWLNFTSTFFSFNEVGWGCCELLGLENDFFEMFGRHWNETIEID